MDYQGESLYSFMSMCGSTLSAGRRGPTSRFRTHGAGSLSQNQGGPSEQDRPRRGTRMVSGRRWGVNPRCSGCGGSSHRSWASFPQCPRSGASPRTGSHPRPPSSPDRDRMNHNRSLSDHEPTVNTKLKQDTVRLDDKFSYSLISNL